MAGDSMQVRGGRGLPTSRKTGWAKLGDFLCFRAGVSLKASTCYLGYREGKQEPRDLNMRLEVLRTDHT